MQSPITGAGSERVGGVTSRLRRVLHSLINEGLVLTAFIFLFSSEAELCGSAEARERCPWCGQLYWISAEMSARGSFANWVQ